MDLQEVGWEHELNRSGSGYGHVAGTCKWGNESTGSIKCREFRDWEPVSFSKTLLFGVIIIIIIIIIIYFSSEHAIRRTAHWLTRYITTSTVHNFIFNIYFTLFCHIHLT
jgi:hypothetical protein